MQRLATFLDRPLFPWKKLIATFSISQYLLDSYLSYRQYKVLCGTKIPQALKAEIDQKTFDKSQAYGRAKAKFGFVSGLFSQCVEMAVLYYNVYPRLWEVTGSWIANYAPGRFSGEITHSLVFMFTYGFVQSLIGLPFSYYNHFVMEEKFGFNKQTVKIWVADFFKSQGLGLALGIPIGSAFLAIIKQTGQNFFLYLWVFALVIQASLITVFPILIVPLFNKLSPLPAGSLKDSVEKLAQRLKFPLTELQVIDGSKRSAHSNAYFTGLPWKKKIVLFDTLIEKSEEEEVVAVLAHELGHWKMGHTTKQLGIAQAHLFFMFSLFSAFINNKSLYNDFGFHRENPIIIGFMLFSEVLSPTESVIGLLMNILSRKFEFEAGKSLPSPPTHPYPPNNNLLTSPEKYKDAFGARLGYSRELASSLIKLQIQNLSAMDADWMYSAYHYSHPILTERLRALGWDSSVKVSKEVDNGEVVKASDREL